MKRVYNTNKTILEKYSKVLSIQLAVVLIIITFLNIIILESNRRSSARIKEYNPAVKIDLDPIRFTIEELETFYRKHTIQAYAGTPTDDLIIEIFGDDADWAFRCLKSENATHGADRENINRDGTKDIGVFQVNSYWHCGKLGYARSSAECEDELRKPEVNIRIAKQIYDSSGPRAWYGGTCN